MVKAISNPLPDDNCYKELCEETLETPKKLSISNLKSRIVENKQIRKLAVE